MTKLHAVVKEFAKSSVQMKAIATLIETAIVTICHNPRAHIEAESFETAHDGTIDTIKFTENDLPDEGTYTVDVVLDKEMEALHKDFYLSIHDPLVPAKDHSETHHSYTFDVIDIMEAISGTDNLELVSEAMFTLGYVDFKIEYDGYWWTITWKDR